ncbi:HAAS signaling domain-containing protein [Kineococcus glutinatus]|uniref:DUF1707 domain-containing protein n=1 Tax=Kineococcus glutinatus TaxID=1070872 RepID=A0ABP9HN54_9ACTN
MTGRTTGSTTLYTADLGRRLRWRGLDEEEIRDAVATVEEHVSESGRSAVESFGRPRDYARTFTARASPPRTWAGYVVGWLVASLVGALLWSGLDAGRDGTEVLGLLDPGVAVTIAALVLAAWAATLLLQLTRGPRR